MHYTLYYEEPSLHFLKIKAEINIEPGQQNLEIHLASWRPGRYELGNYAKNIVKFEVFNPSLQAIPFLKTNKDTWNINLNGESKIYVEYVYYAFELNAGSTYINEEQLYVNPCNCLIYVKEQMNQAHTLQLNIPNNFQVAIGLPKVKPNVYEAQNFDELADSPFIASSSLKQHTFLVENVPFNLWFMGECKPDLHKIENLFTQFIQVQHTIFKSFPFTEYHFLYQILPRPNYHGVEHQNNTVIALGPGYQLMEDHLFEDFMGISSHELFHAWNIKKIRPIEMFPYDYSKENYSKLGYVAEGVTTYYGDVCLYRSKYFTDQQFNAFLSETITKYMENEGRNNMSVAQASYDTWLDGYVKGVPNRKTSIYNEGSLIALLTDYLIRKNSNNKNSLDQVMHTLYHDFANKNKPYSENDYWNIVELFAGQSFIDFTKKYIDGTQSYLEELTHCLEYFGLHLNEDQSPKYCEKHLGFKTTESGSVSNIYVNSPAWKSGLAHGDDIVAVQKYHVKANANLLDKWLQYFDQPIVLTVLRNEKLVDIPMQKDENTYFKYYKVTKNLHAHQNMKDNFQKWTWREF